MHEETMMLLVVEKNADDMMFDAAKNCFQAPNAYANVEVDARIRTSSLSLRIFRSKKIREMMFASRTPMMPESRQK